jgi:serine/threonine protein kinase
MSNIPPKLTPEQVSGLCPEFSDITEIGAGGHKTVYRARIAEVTEAIKVISLPRAGDSEDLDRLREEFIGRIHREVDILSKCKSPQMVKLGMLPLNTHSVNGDMYAVYSEEFLEGFDLWRIIRGKSSLPDEQEARLLMKSLLLAVKEIWSMHYIHRDIKPHNVIKLSDSNRPFVLIDLGIAFCLLEPGLTVSGAPCTLRYMAPEMADPHFRSNLDFRTDLYGVALTVFEYAAGQHPIARDRDDMIRTVTRVLKNSPKPLQELRPEFSSSFCKLIDQLLKKKPHLRSGSLEYLISQTDAKL